TSLLMIAILLSGWVAYYQLPVAALPQVDYPTIQVLTFYPGAGPEVMTSNITAPLEQQFGQIPGLTQMTSSSTQGCSAITLQFELELDIDVAVQQVQSAINTALNFLPRDLPNPPIFSKVNPADAPILTFALTSDSIPLSKIQDLADTRLAQKLSQVTGVGQVTVTGGQKPAIRVQANPTALSAVSLTLEDIRLALVAANVNQAKGSFDGPKQSIIIGANDQLDTADQFRELIITYRNGAPVKLRDVANVVDDVENIRQAAWTNTHPAVLLNIQRQPGANIIDVVDRIYAMLPQLRESLPATIQVDVLTDRTITIRASVQSVEHELLLTVALVVFVIFVFLGSIRATIIPSAAVPLSIVGTFGLMYLLGFTLNNLTLMALTISTGFVVDDAIVMIENIMRYIEEGMDPMAASLRGAKEIGFTIVSLSVSLVAVLIPLLFMGDVVGRLFREFAITLSVTIAISAIISLTLTPMMCAYLLKAVKHQPKREEALITSGYFGWIQRAYGWTLQWTLRHQLSTMALFALTFVATVYLYFAIPKGLFPVQDTGVILGFTEVRQDTSFQNIKERQQKLNEILVTDPAVQSIASFIGIDGINMTMHTGRIQINLKPHALRNETITDVMHRLSEMTELVSGIELFMQPVQDISVDTRVARTQFQYSLENPDVRELEEFVPRFVERLSGRPELRDVTSDNSSLGREMELVIDRDTASRLGVTPLMIDDALYSAFGQRQVSTIFTQVNQYRVILEVLPEFRDSTNDISSLYVKTGAGRITPLESISTTRQTQIPLSVNHQGQFPVVTVSFNVAPGMSLGDAVRAVEETVQELNMPASTIGEFQGSAQTYQKSLQTTPQLILAALITVYIVLGVLYESYVHPLTILSTLPSAGVGALLGLMLYRLDFGVIAVIGIILLIGIVKKNAIMMIDFALEAQRHGGKSPQDAIYEACLLRLRPILMTTFAALLGAVPLAFSFGVGAELRKPLGISIIGGLLISQVLTLYSTPVIYLWFEAIRSWMGRRRRIDESV
ncbi:MAG: efflux RND transporter permease subunit, partial [Pirellulales bacterium]